MSRLTQASGNLREFGVLCALGIFAILSSTMAKSPTLSLFAKSLGAGTAEIGVIAAASTVVGVFTNVTAGTLSDIYGRRNLILVAALVFASAPLLYLLVTSPWQLILVRAYHGVATATLAPVMSAAIADMFPSRRGERMALLTSFQYVGRLLAPLLGGFLISQYGFVSVFLTCAGSGAIALAFAMLLFFLPKTRPNPIERRQVFGRLRGIHRQEGLLSLGSTQALVYLSFGPVETFLPIYAQGLGLSPVEIGALLSIQTAMTLFAGPVVGDLSDRIGRRLFVVVGLVVAAVSLVFLPFSLGFFSLLFVMVGYGTGFTMATTVIPPLVSDLSSAELYGASLGALETIKDVGQTLGPVIVGVAISLVGYLGAFSFIGLIVAADAGYVRWTLTRLGRGNLPQKPRGSRSG